MCLRPFLLNVRRYTASTPTSSPQKTTQNEKRKKINIYGPKGWLANNVHGAYNTKVCLRQLSNKRRGEQKESHHKYDTLFVQKTTTPTTNNKKVTVLQRCLPIDSRNVVSIFFCSEFVTKTVDRLNICHSKTNQTKEKTYESTPPHQPTHLSPSIPDTRRRQPISAACSAPGKSA